MSKPDHSASTLDLDPATLIRFSRRGTKSWIAAVDRFHAATDELATAQEPLGNVVNLWPAQNHAGRLSAYHQAAFGLIEHDEQPPREEARIIRLMATLRGDRDPAWLENAQPDSASDALWAAAYKAALRRADSRAA